MIKEHGNNKEKKEDLEHWLHNCQFELRVHSKSTGPHRTLKGLSLASQTFHVGAGKWIKVFEEETMGKLLAVGDIKALLAKTIGGAKMEEILQASNVERAVDSHNMDGTVFDAFRPAVWQALRGEYPIRLNPKSIKGENSWGKQKIHPHMSRDS